MKVEFTPVTDYAAAVEALVNRKVDLAWFGGFTFVQAQAALGRQGRCPMVQREEDEKFKLGGHQRRCQTVKSLADLKGKDFSFGSQSSTSGHLMPRHFLAAAGPGRRTRSFRRVAFSGAHDATIAAVASRSSVTAGALNISVWEKFVDEKKVDPTAGARDLHHAALLRLQLDRARRPAQAATRDKLLPGLPERSSPAAPQADEILKLQRATRFVPTQAENYARHRSRRPRPPACCEASASHVELQGLSARHPALRSRRPPDTLRGHQRSTCESGRGGGR
jgi:phosphonate transport system substrate-binding protein